MAGDSLQLLDGMMQKLEWREQRHKTLAQNVANADTPGYKPQDILSPDFKSMLGSSASKLPLHATGLMTTNSNHISLGGASGKAVTAREKTQKHTYETSPSGNAVVLEEQLVKLQENMTDHMFISNLYQKQMDMLKASTKSQ